MDMSERTDDLARYLALGTRGTPGIGSVAEARTCPQKREHNWKDSRKGTSNKQ